MTNDQVAFLVEKIDDVRERVDRHEEASQKRHEHLDHIIRGNGTPGLVSRVYDLEQTRSRHDWLAKAAIGAVIAQFVFYIGKTFFA